MRVLLKNTNEFYCNNNDDAKIFKCVENILVKTDKNFYYHFNSIVLLNDISRKIYRFDDFFVLLKKGTKIIKDNEVCSLQENEYFKVKYQLTDGNDSVIHAILPEKTNVYLNANTDNLFCSLCKDYDVDLQRYEGGGPVYLEMIEMHSDNE
jgi:hypothetical protein